MVEKSTGQPEVCEGCDQAHECRRIDERLGNVEGPCVALQVIVAFVLPIVVFTGTLATCDRLLDGLVPQRYETPLAFIMALLVAAGFVLVAHAVSRRLHQSKQHPESRE